MELFTLFGKIAVNDKDANKSIDSVTGKAKQSESVMGKAFSNIGKVVAGAFTVGAIATFEKKIVSTYATYDDQMRKVQAVSGATGKQFMELRSKAEELGAKTRFSATEAGEGMEMLARAGWKTGDIMKGIGPVLNFATANAIDLGQAAGIVSDGLSQFGLKAKDTTMFTDVLSATAAAANTDIGLLGETFKYVGPVAGSLGYKLQDVSVAIGLMANKGIKGSQAGTSLRSALTRLANPTGDSAKLMKELGISITDSTGKVKPFNALMQELRGKFSKLSDAQKAQYASTIFGQEAMSGMLAVVNSSDEEFNKMTKAIAESSGQTQKMANTMDGGLGGALANVQSAWEGLLIKLGEMQDGPLVDGLNGLAKILQGLPNEIQYVSNKFKEFTNFLKEHETAIKTIGIIFGTIMTGFVLNSLKLKIAEKGVLAFIKSFGLVKNIGPMLKGVGTVFTFLTTSVGLVTIGVAAFAAAAYLIYKNWDKIGPWLKNQWEFIKNTASDVWNGIKEIVFNVVESVVQFIQDVWGGLVNIVNTVFTAVGNAISTAWNFIKTIFTVALLAIKFVVQTGFALIVTIIRVPLELIKALFQTIWNFIGGYVMNVINTIVTFITTAWNNVVTVTSTVFNAVANVVSTIWNAIYGVIAGVVGTVAGYVSSIWATIVAYTTTYFNAAKVVVQSVWKAISNVISNVVNSIKNVISTAWNYIATTTSNIFNSVKNTASNIWSGIKNTISNVVNGIKNTVSNVWTGIKSTTTNVWNNIKNAMVTPINAAKNTIQNVINKIKGFFTNLKLRFPKIQMPKLPHFSLNGKFSLAPPSVPKLAVDYYAKGGVMTKPTIFGMMNGRAQVGGEAGPEAVAPIDVLMGYVRKAVSEAMPNENVDNEKDSDTPFIIQIENMNVRGESDIRAIAEELEFYRKRNSLAKGGAY